jgi:hypothetical protein
MSTDINTISGSFVYLGVLPMESQHEFSLLPLQCEHFAQAFARLIQHLPVLSSFLQNGVARFRECSGKF